MTVSRKDANSVASCAPGLLFRCASDSPAAIAIEAPEATLSYGELEIRTATLAAQLRDSGVGANTLVAICLPRSAMQIAALLAAWRAGAAYLPLDSAWPEARLAALVAGADCAALIADPAMGARIAGTVPVIDPHAPAGIAPLAATQTDPDSLAYVIYTSGSTGSPKAVEVTHANLAALIEWHCEAFAVQAGTRTSHLAGLGFDAAAWEVWPTLSAGGTIVLVDEESRLDPARLRNWLIARRIAVAFAPTALAEPLIRMDWPADAPLRHLLTGADRLIARPAPGLPFAFVNNYGPTECTVVATSGVVGEDGDGLPSIGRPIKGTTLHLLAEDGSPVPPGTRGEIWIGGVQVARGYRGDPALTAMRFVTHEAHGRLYRSGDVGTLLASGEIAFGGRTDDQAKVRGHRIEPAEVSAALNLLPAIASSCVTVRDGELLAYVVPAEGASPTASALRAALLETLPDYMVPGRFALLTALPLTPNGKVDLKALPDPAHCAMPEAEAGRAPVTPTQLRLFDIVADVIERRDFSIDDDFFLLGGHSLLGTQVVLRARDAFGIELTLFHLFEGRTVDRLAHVVEELVIAKLDAMSDEDIRRMTGS